MVVRRAVVRRATRRTTRRRVVRRAVVRVVRRRFRVVDAAAFRALFLRAICFNPSRGCYTLERHEPIVLFKCLLHAPLHHYAIFCKKNETVVE